MGLAKWVTARIPFYKFAKQVVLLICFRTCILNEIIFLQLTQNLTSKNSPWWIWLTFALSQCKFTTSFLLGYISVLVSFSFFSVIK
jgi:hypothetical protein